MQRLLTTLLHLQIECSEIGQTEMIRCAVLSALSKCWSNQWKQRLLFACTDVVIREQDYTQIRMEAGNYQTNLGFNTQAWFSIQFQQDNTLSDASLIYLPDHKAFTAALIFSNFHKWGRSWPLYSNTAVFPDHRASAEAYEWVLIQLQQCVGLQVERGRRVKHLLPSANIKYMIMIV